MRLDLTDEFFKPEVRDGFYISTMMKKLWAAEMKVLSEIDRVCEENGIRWFLDNGSLLGAVRHNGYIPWDDDMDICMLREDYERFLAVAERSLPAGYQVVNVRTDPECFDLTTRINNSGSIRTDDEFLKANYGFLYCAGVDIFPLDELSPDEAAETERIKKINDIETLARLLYEDPEGENTWRLFDRVEKENNVTIQNGKVSQQLNLLIEKNYRCFEGQGGDRVGLIHYWSANRSHAYEKRWFDLRLTMDFEGQRFFVPGAYEEVLKVEYGDFIKPVRGGNLHDYPIYKKQEELLTRHLNFRPLHFPFRETAAKYGFRMPEGKEKELIMTDPMSGWENTDGTVNELILEPALQPDALDSDDLLKTAIEEQVLSMGTLFSNKIRLKSENLKKLWIGLLNAEVPEIPWEKKIEVDPYGSEDCEIKAGPGRSEDRELKTDPCGDGSQAKKLLIYGTGWSALCAFRKKALLKMRQVLSLLENTENMDFLWITPAFLEGEAENLKAFREKEPQLFDEYIALTEKYRDHAAKDPAGSIRICSAYYGDPGVWANMCRAFKKPVMIQNTDIVETF